VATYFVSNSGSNTAPYDTEAKAATTLGVIEAIPWTNADTVKVSSTHTETVGASKSYVLPASPGMRILSVTFNGSGTGGLAAGGTISAGVGSFNITFATGHGYIYGLTINGGSTAGTGGFIALAGGTNPVGLVFESCNFITIATGTSTFRLGCSQAIANDDIYVKLVGCVFNFSGSNVGKSILIRSGVIELFGCTLAGTTVTTLFTAEAAASCSPYIRDCDFSGIAWTNLYDVSNASYVRPKLRNCRLRSGFTVTTGTYAGPGGNTIELIDCNSGDVNYYYFKGSYAGTILASNAVYYDAGDGTDSISWLMSSSANAKFELPLMAPEINYYNKTLSSTITTVECVNDGTTFKDNELWQETVAKTTSGVPLGTWNLGDRAADILAAGANQTTSSVSWTGTGGFGAAVKQKLESTSFTPAENGIISVNVKLAKASATVYVSPRVFTGSRQWMSADGYINEPATTSGGGTRIY
jgi:hypothetical protein